MAIKLHDYQIECIDVIHKTFKKSDKQIVQLPTGSGKTFIFLNFLKKYASSALIICPSLELQEQIYEWGCIFLGKSNIEKGWKHDLVPFHVVTLASLNKDKTFNKVNAGVFEYIIMDEAHHGCAPSFVKFLSKLKKQRKILGLTATPERLDSKNLLSIFDKLTFEKNIIDMIELKQLSDIEAYKIKTSYELKFTSHGEDFCHADLRELDSHKRNSIILNTIKKECSDKKTLIFCLNVNHAIKIAEKLKSMGFAAECIHGKMKYQQRRQILDRFASGKTMFLTNCQLLTEGFDEPSIEALVLARPTRSKSLYCQMIGRGLRKHPGKDKCLLYELADNNHKICTFNVLGGLSPDIGVEYNNGLKLSKLKEFLQTIDYEEILLEKCKHEIFDLTKKINDNFSFKCFDMQKEKLRKIGVPEMALEFLSFMEAEFLLFKHRLKVKYGFV